MKKYTVLEAHQGDKFYKPGDPETGTRIADPNAVGHLVTLGLLEEIGDADVPEPQVDDGDTVADLRFKIEVLGNDRDDMRTAFVSEIGDLRTQIGTLTQERDAAATQAAATVTDLRDQVTALTAGLEAMREDIATLDRRVKEPVSGDTAPDGEEGSSDAQDAAAASRKARSAK